MITGRAVLRTTALALVAVVGLAGCTSSKGSGAPRSTALAETGVPSTSGAASSSASASPSVYPTLKTSAVPTTVQSSKAPIPVRSTATFGGGVTGAITAIRPVTVKATVPGDVSGPSLAVTIRLVNGSSRPIQVGNAVVNLAYGPALTPANPVNASPTKPLAGTVASGRSTVAVYVFNVAKADQNDTLSIQVSYSPTAPVVTFTGRK